MYNLPLTTTLAAPLLRGGTTLPGGNATLLHVKCCLSSMSLCVSAAGDMESAALA